MKFQLYAPILLLILAIVVPLTLGFIFLYRTRKLINKSHRADGLIINLIVRSQDEAGSYTPVVRFTAQDGREIEFEDRRAKRRTDFKVGEQVLVLYHPNNFNKARIFTTNRDMYYSTILMLGLGTVFLLSGVLMGVVFGALYLLGAMEKD